MTGSSASNKNRLYVVRTTLNSEMLTTHTLEEIYDVHQKIYLPILQEVEKLDGGIFMVHLGTIYAAMTAEAAKKIEAIPQVEQVRLATAVDKTKAVNLYALSTALQAVHVAFWHAKKAISSPAQQFVMENDYWPSMRSTWNDYQQKRKAQLHPQQN